MTQVHTYLNVRNVLVSQFIVLNTFKIYKYILNIWSIKYLVIFELIFQITVHYLKKKFFYLWYLFVLWKFFTADQYWQADFNATISQNQKEFPILLVMVYRHGRAVHQGDACASTDHMFISDTSYVYVCKHIRAPDSQSVLRKSLSSWNRGKLSQLSGGWTSRAASMSAE